MDQRFAVEPSRQNKNGETIPTTARLENDRNISALRRMRISLAVVAGGGERSSIGCAGRYTAKKKANAAPQLPTIRRVISAQNQEIERIAGRQGGPSRAKQKGGESSKIHETPYLLWKRSWRTTDSGGRKWRAGITLRTTPSEHWRSGN